MKTVISASRRTDIPAFYMPWFMACMKKGAFRVVNPFNNRAKVVPAGPDQVHSIVFWSKNFDPFLAGGYGRRLKEMGYHLFFNFTVNSESPVLEPGVPPLGRRVEQLAVLAGQAGPGAVNWRFDPLCFYSAGNGAVENNMAAFSIIAAAAAEAGIERCITSFMDFYPKIERRLKKKQKIAFCDPPMETKIEILYGMQETLETYGMELQMCCERELLENLPVDLPIRASACVPNRLLAELYGNAVSLKKDAGQRVKAGCGCGVSVDIGSYRDHPCYHKCLYCYARPAGS